MTITLQQKLRMLRSYQGLTLARCARKAGGFMPPKMLVPLENGDVSPSQSGRYEERYAKAYGISPETMGDWLQWELDWRMATRPLCAHPETLPRMARYLYKSLPEVAHNLFTDGFVVLDCETTGLDPHNGVEICEITILNANGIPLLDTLIKTANPIPEQVTALHGISNEMVASAPSFKEVYPEIARIISGQTVVIYNANYDAYLLDRLIIENYLDMPSFDAWCLMEAYKGHIQAERWVKLAVACESEGVKIDQTLHRALGDTALTYRLLQKMALQYSEPQASVEA